MSYKFTGNVPHIEVKDHKLLYLYGEKNDEYILGEEKEISEYIDFMSDILPELKAHQQLKCLDDGVYYIYFTGTVEIGFTQEFYEGWVEAKLDYVNWQKL